MPTYRIVTQERRPSVWEAWFSGDEQVKFLGSSPEDAARRLVEGSRERRPDVSSLVPADDENQPGREFLVTGM